MKREFAALLFAGIAALTACGGGGGYSPPSSGGNSGGGSTAPTSGVGTDAIGIALPTGMGTVNSQFGTVGGYTQSVYSQVLAFPPGTTITLKNLAANTPHTLNVLSMTGFPSSPALSTSASGGTTLGNGYASGTIPGGGSVTVTLSNPGTYYIGCAYHYLSNQMRDVLLVAAGATPGPQATPAASGSSGCSGIYC